MSLRTFSWLRRQPGHGLLASLIGGPLPRQGPPAQHRREPRACSGCALLLQATRCYSSRNRTEGKVLETVGVLEAPREGKYDTGQLFLHRVFGYRGVVLFPWQARLYDRDLSGNDNESKAEPPAAQTGKEVRGKTHTYYQVLIDARDCPHICAQTEGVTFLANHEDSRALYAIPGLDYVSHEDILPYNSMDKTPIQHELFDRFLHYDATKVPVFAARDTLHAWQQKNHPWLELSDVHRETTEGIRVTVTPFYMGARVQCVCVREFTNEEVHEGCFWAVGGSRPLARVEKQCSRQPAEFWVAKTPRVGTVRSRGSASANPLNPLMTPWLVL